MQDQAIKAQAAMEAAGREAAAKFHAADAARKMLNARTSLILGDVTLEFFASLTWGLKIMADPTCQTAWVDGRTLGYSPAYILSLPHPQRVTLIGHEVMHVALGHPWRRGDRDHHLYNIAADKVINHILREAGFQMMADVYYAQDEEIGKSTEWIYSHGPQPKQVDQPQPQDGQPGMPKPQDDEQDGQPKAQEDAPDGQDDPQDGQGEGQGESDQPGEGDAQNGPQTGAQGGTGKPQPVDVGSSMGDVRDAPQGADEAGDECASHEEWKERVRIAKAQAEMQGTMGAGLERALDQALQPKVDVRSILLRFMQERAANDYTWTRPSRRYIAQGLYLPQLHSTQLGEVAIMVDTSGSVDDLALQAARAIVESVLDECQPKAVSIYYADAKVCRVDRFDKGEPLTWQPKGGGGTNFCPALKAIEEDEQPVCVVCISDLYGTFPTVAPDLPIIWLSTTEHKVAPFGDTVYTGE